LKITARQSFIRFLGLLREDFINNPEGRENKTLPAFLEALATYTEDIQGYYNNINASINADKPEWATFADILKELRLMNNKVSITQSKNNFKTDIIDLKLYQNYWSYMHKSKYRYQVPYALS